MKAQAPLRRRRHPLCGVGTGGARPEERSVEDRAARAAPAPRGRRHFEEGQRPGVCGRVAWSRGGCRRLSRPPLSPRPPAVPGGRRRVPGLSSARAVVALGCSGSRARVPVRARPVSVGAAWCHLRVCAGQRCQRSRPTVGNVSKSHVENWQ